MTQTSAPVTRSSVATKALRFLILAYQGASGGRRPACRFVPSCSNYALEAIDRFGARKGIPLVLRRLARCRPGGPFGLDPVPDELSPRSAGKEGPGSGGTGSSGPGSSGPSSSGPSSSDAASAGAARP